MPQDLFIKRHLTSIILLLLPLLAYWSVARIGGLDVVALFSVLAFASSLGAFLRVLRDFRRYPALDISAIFLIVSVCVLLLTGYWAVVSYNVLSRHSPFAEFWSDTHKIRKSDFRI